MRALVPVVLGERQEDGTVPMTSKTEKRRMNDATKDDRSKATKELRSMAISVAALAAFPHASRSRV